MVIKFVMKKSGLDFHTVKINANVSNTKDFLAVRSQVDSCMEAFFMNMLDDENAKEYANTVSTVPYGYTDEEDDDIEPIVFSDVDLDKEPVENDSEV